MKLRLTPDSVRLRLNRLDMARFVRDEAVSERVDFPGSNTGSFRYVLRTGTGYGLTFAEGNLTIDVPREEVTPWARDTERIGLYETYRMANGKTLRLIVEKDFQCIDGPPEEFDPLGYAHPAAKEACALGTAGSSEEVRSRRA